MPMNLPARVLGSMALVAVLAGAAWLLWSREGGPDPAFWFDETTAVRVRGASASDATGVPVARARRIRRAAAWLARLESLDVGAHLQVRLNLFPDAAFELDVERVRGVGGGAREWWGRGRDPSQRFLLLRSPSGEVDPAVARGAATWLGTLRDGGRRTFRVQALPGGADFLVEELGKAHEGRCAVRGADGERDPKSGRPTLGVVPSTIDVLACYTAKAALRAGQGVRRADHLVWGRVQFGVAETNQAFADSGVVHSLRLLAPERPGQLCIEDDEATAPDGILAHMQGGATDGMRTLRSLRDALGGDLVLLVVGSLSCETCCGRARVMPVQRDPSGALVGDDTFAERAFSAVDYGCTFDAFFTIAHEIAHNLGCCHDRSNVDDECSAKPEEHADEAHGHLFVVRPAEGERRAQGLRTVMALPDPRNPCQDCGRIGLFSGPGCLYQDGVGAPRVPTGIAGQADNVSILNATGHAASTFRPARRAP